MYKKTKKTLEYIMIAAFLLFVGWATLLMVDWVGSMVEPEVSAEYESAPAALKLKSAPDEVLFAEAYETESGAEVKYAYMAGEPEPHAGEDETRRTPSSRTEVLDVKIEDGKKIETLKTTFYAKPQFYEDNGQWRQIEYATTTPEIFAASGAVKYVKRREWWERLVPGNPVFAVTSTFYPDAHTESTTVDGHINASGSHFDAEGFCSQAVAFSSARSATTGSASDSSSNLTVSVSVSGSGQNCSSAIYRSLVLFDTSSLGASAEITSATFSAYVLGKTNIDNDGDDYIGVVSSAPSSNTAVVGGDYDSLGGVLYAQYDITSMTTSAYVDIPLNASGEASISLTGVTKFGLLEGHDYLGNTPSNNALNSVGFSSADTTGTSQDPKLEVTYTVGSFSFGQWFPF